MFSLEVTRKDKLHDLFTLVQKFKRQKKNSSDLLFEIYLQLFSLEATRKDKLHDLATLVQKIWRGYRQKKEFRQMKAAEIKIASFYRMYKVGLRMDMTWEKRYTIYCLKYCDLMYNHGYKKICISIRDGYNRYDR